MFPTVYRKIPGKPFRAVCQFQTEASAESYLYDLKSRAPADFRFEIRSTEYNPQRLIVTNRGKRTIGIRQSPR